MDIEERTRTNTTTIRRARFADLGAVFLIEKTAFGRHALDPSTLFWLVFRRWPGFLVGETDNTISGYVITRLSLWPPRSRVGGISSIAVHPDYRRRGAGRALMLEALQFLKEAGARSIELEVDVRNASAISLYRSLGFVNGQTLPNYYGPGEDGMKMYLRTIKSNPQKGSTTRR